MSSGKGPVVLIVRDGWGRNPHAEHDAFNAVKLASTPACDALLRDFRWTLLHTSGEQVGLPEGTMGNSEVGHQNLGAGRVVNQDSVRISQAVRSGEFLENDVLCAAVKRARAADRPVHLMGIASDAGVHGRLGHIYGCLALCGRLGAQAVLHLFTDGRDTGPYTAVDFLRRIEARCAEVGVGRIVSLCGRYYAMDRDNRWERGRRADDMLTGRGPDLPCFSGAVEAAGDYYDRPSDGNLKGDEFITPRYVGGDWQRTRLRSGDSVIFTNCRGDRPREITRALVMPQFQGHVPPSADSGEKGFDRGPGLDLHYVTMTAYEAALCPWVHVAFPKPPKLADVAGAALADRGLRQFRCAETEKFPHVTFFFNDYREEPFAGESRGMAQSPSVATYDMQPQMSAGEVTDIVEQRLEADDCEDFILVNFANADMVGHTGKLEAAVRAVETVDGCVGRVVAAARSRGGRLIVTADHGNAEQMFDPVTNAPHTAHTTYDVECVLVGAGLEKPATGDPEAPSTSLRKGGCLADVFPTVLDLMGQKTPQAMTGRSLLER
jgi:2,3-bisphosphoglycerate-independent phosphoglycerate mutase